MLDLLVFEFHSIHHLGFLSVSFFISIRDGNLSYGTRYKRKRRLDKRSKSSESGTLFINPRETTKKLYQPYCHSFLGLQGVSLKNLIL